ncbi:MAG: aminoacyl-tRNA hydrolase [Candidatus Wildermuthbacteria bacterium]|nr:aminoacyl-tRNA hydrolase [Candidatus Wildermuthbacteria bacterium]
MFLIVGLGNPGKEYEHTRHNAGFMALDAFQKEHGFPDFKLSKKHLSLISEGILGSTKVVLAKPQMFMNSSGKAVVSLAKPSFSKLGLAKELIVIHDDIDILLGKVKVSKGSGSAGHKGADSIIQALGTKDFTRIRIGILPKEGKPADVEDFVLRKFSKDETAMLSPAIEAARQSLVSCIEK